MSILKNIDNLILNESFTFAMPDALAELNRQLIELNNNVRDYFRKPPPLEYTQDGTPPKEVVDDLIKSLRIQNIINTTPELLQGYVKNFFKTFDQDPTIGKLIELSETNPNYFISILIAIATTLSSLLIGGGIYFYKKISNYKVSPTTLDSIQNTLENAKTDKEKKEAIKQLAELSAKHIIYVKFVKE